VPEQDNLRSAMNLAIFPDHSQLVARPGQRAGEQAMGLRPDTGRGGAAGRSAAAALLPSTWLKVVLAGGLSLLALAVVAAQFRSGALSAKAPLLIPSPMSPQAAPSPSPTSGAARPVEPVPWQGSESMIDSLPVPASGTASPAERIRWQGSELMIDLDQVPLPQAIALLARVTDTAMTGVQLLQERVPVTMHGRFSDVTKAWQYLLQSHAGFSMSCGASDCQVWIVSAIDAPAATETQNAERTPPGAAGAPASTAPTEVESQPGGSC
jgi:hypothetical protein